ncbi:Phosphatidylinositol:ceramide phosphoinositol transferase (IPC synthase) [Friedmanniomyces endolithicus]|uniref:Phosphatidylinositol:ceramide phosphoinositol transferase (IPC synthase) n=1 Tax=Friedmanniomyces endolithicus TaxID=329885 RepID=A0AAN6QLG0_9PEZI|nr:Phosphatidylinositol:ceramide phosphoinositol transferase (IPC synthase) [Friedmanniomyces endolithicus]KAK0853249.1 Phosphatidylinositol:ceramide phosphoinositol transferase (IPC synthase) [Friedmanniomyces endolithicus]KAK0881565.1 Phosphatidylinositol:ceramide phosphoinositol transferase (IPC synthase) [Friedmanniomyces endolithicus]KAK0907292.1 Phosphatidylinositol:ceramide phosphoinositol transferase (IPC synthase) [Friedmanniomyces endolithicus]KAK0910881.1 Phosphatidylinositol:ceramid
MLATDFTLDHDEHTTRPFFFAQTKLPLSWPSLPAILPHRIRRKLRHARAEIRARQSPTTSIASLHTSINPADTLRALRRHRWRAHDAQYLLLAAVGIFNLCVIQTPGPTTKTFLTSLLLTGLALPLTNQLLLPALPVLAWLTFFYSCQFLPATHRPQIWVRLLPALENMLYGANLSALLSAHKSTPLDLLAWLPYGAIHYASPVVVSAITFLFGPPGTLPVWARIFGYMCLTGVVIQLCFPCAPPWYENKYGLAPANYSIHGEAAGLAAIDRLLGNDFYTAKFAASPVVFGAFPSLHSAWATLEMLFMSSLFPRWRPAFVFYLLWLWWSTMYLSHHYAVDLVAGSLISGIAYFIARGTVLPRVQAGKTFRWDYEFVEFGEAPEDCPEDHPEALNGYDGAAYHYRSERDLDEYPLPLDSLRGDCDEWTLGSSSCMSGSSRAASVGLRSPVVEDWDGETLGSGSEGEEQQRYHKI